MPQQQQEQHEPLTMEQGFNLAYFAANCGFRCVSPFTRSGSGKRDGGLDLGVAAFVMLWIAGWSGSQAMLNYFTWWVVMVIFPASYAGKGGDHSVPRSSVTTIWLVRDEMFARIVEAVGVWALGVWVMPHSVVMGKFFVIVGVLMAVKCWIERSYLSRVDEAMEDEILIMQQHIEDRNGDDNAR